MPSSPGDGEVVLTNTPTLTWGYRGCGPDSFRVQVADNQFFQSGRGLYVASVDLAGTARRVVWSPLTCQKTYWWRMSATADGTTTAWTISRTMYVDC